MKLDLIDVMGQLFPDPLTVVTQLCATAILFFVLLKLVWKPAKKIMDARSEYEQKKIKISTFCIILIADYQIKCKDFFLGDK